MKIDHLLGSTLGASLFITQRKMKFLDVSIGAIFFAHDCFWVRTDYSSATSIGPATDNRSTPFGSCSFTTDPQDEFVTVVELR